jgi:hypothetical protein
MQRPPQRSAFSLDFFLQQGDGVDQLLGTGRAARDVRVDGNYMVHALHQGVVIKDSKSRTLPSRSPILGSGICSHS